MCEMAYAGILLLPATRPPQRLLSHPLAAWRSTGIQACGWARLFSSPATKHDSRPGRAGLIRWRIGDAARTRESPERERSNIWRWLGRRVEAHRPCRRPGRPIAAASALAASGRAAALSRANLWNPPVRSCGQPSLLPPRLQPQCAKTIINLHKRNINPLWCILTLEIGLL